MEIEPARAAARHNRALRRAWRNRRSGAAARRRSASEPAIAVRPRSLSCDPVTSESIRLSVPLMAGRRVVPPTARSACDCLCYALAFKFGCHCGTIMAHAPTATSAPRDAAAERRRRWSGSRCAMSSASRRRAGKLTDYLRRKIRERGWGGEAAPDPDGAGRTLADLGYIDDRAFAEARAAAMGAARAGRAARDARRCARPGSTSEDAEAVAPAIEETRGRSALAFARRKRIGPFAREVAGSAAARKADRRDGARRACSRLARQDRPDGARRRCRSIARDSIETGFAQSSSTSGQCCVKVSSVGGLMIMRADPQLASRRLRRRGAGVDADRTPIMASGRQCLFAASSNGSMSRGASAFSSPTIARSAISSSISRCCRSMAGAALPEGARVECIAVQRERGLAGDARSSSIDLTEAVEAPPRARRRPRRPAGDDRRCRAVRAGHGQMVQSAQGLWIPRARQRLGRYIRPYGDAAPRRDRRGRARTAACARASSRATRGRSRSRSKRTG